MTICDSSSRDSNTSSESYMHKRCMYIYVVNMHRHIMIKPFLKVCMTYAMYLPFYQTFQ